MQMLRVKISNLLKTKKFLIIVFFALVAGVGGYFAISSNRDNAQENFVISRNDICNDDAIGNKLKTEFPNFGPEKTAQMVDTINDIKATENFNTSINCLYVMGKFSTYTNDYVRSAEYFGALFALYDPNPTDWVNKEISQDTVETVREFYEHTKLVIESNSTKTHENASFPGMRYTE